VVEERSWETFDVDQAMVNKIAELLEVGRSHENHTVENMAVVVVEVAAGD